MTATMARIIAAAIAIYAGISFVAAEWNAFDWPLECRFLFTWIVGWISVGVFVWR